MVRLSLPLYFEGNRTPLPKLSLQFNQTERGDRLTPGLTNPRRWSLILFRQKLTQVVLSDAVPPGDIVLDYGCGNRPYAQILSQKFKRYVGADLQGNTAADLILDEECKLPITTPLADCVLSSQVLEHVADPRAYLAEALRVLKPRGTLVLSTHGAWQYHPDPEDNWRWTVSGLQLEIRRAGFEIVRVDSVLSRVSAVLMLWQDATLPKLHHRLHTLYVFFIQAVIGVIERRREDRLDPNASVFLVVARKRC